MSVWVRFRTIKGKQSFHNIAGVETKCYLYTCERCGTKFSSIRDCITFKIKEDDKEFNNMLMCCGCEYETDKSEKLKALEQL